MIDFSYNSQQNDIREMAFKFAKNEMWPKTSHYDHLGEVPWEILTKAWEVGLVNTVIPENFGGAGFSMVESTIISEALSYGCMGMNTILMANDLTLSPIVIAGTDEQKEKFLRPFTKKYVMGAFCLTEPDNGSDAAGIKTKIDIKGDKAIITGKKMWISNAGFAELFVLYGTIDPELGHKGITAIVIDPQSPGIEIGPPEKKMGHRCADTRSVSFESVEVPVANILGNPGEGWKIAMKTLNHSRPIVAASALGGAQCALDHAKKYALERKQFGVPIAKHQAIQQMISDMAIEVEAARLLITKAAWLLDSGKDNTKLASMAKAYAADICMKTTTNAVQIFGGYGYSVEYPVEKLMRDAKLIQIYEGTSQIQRLVIAREVFAESSNLG